MPYVKQIAGKVCASVTHNSHAAYALRMFRYLNALQKYQRYGDVLRNGNWVSTIYGAI